MHRDFAERKASGTKRPPIKAAIYCQVPVSSLGQDKTQRMCAISIPREGVWVEHELHKPPRLPVPA